MTGLDLAQHAAIRHAARVPSLWTKRMSRAVGATIALPALYAAACYVYWTAFAGRLVTITEDQVYQSAAYAPDDLVATCQAYGIKTVIDLRDTKLEEVRAAADAASLAGIEHVHLATKSHPTVAAAEDFLAAMAAAERPVLVHCEHGEGRSVLLCAIYRIEEEGWTNQQAFDGTARLPDSLRCLNALFPGLRRLGVEDTKGKFVRNYVAAKAADRRRRADQPKD